MAAIDQTIEPFRLHDLLMAAASDPSMGTSGQSASVANGRTLIVDMEVTNRDVRDEVAFAKLISRLIHVQGMRHDAGLDDLVEAAIAAAAVTTARSNEKEKKFEASEECDSEMEGTEESDDDGW